MDSNLATVAPLLLLGALMQAAFGVFWLAAATFKLSVPSARLWALAMFVAGTGLAVSWARPFLDPYWDRLLPNWANILSAGLLWLGVRRFVRLPILWWHWAAPLIGAGGVLTVLVLGFGAPAWVRIGYTMALMAVMLGWAGHHLLRHLELKDWARTAPLLAAPLLLGSLFLAVRSGVSVAVGLTGSSDAPQPPVSNLSPFLMSLYLMLGLLINLALAGALVARLTRKLIDQSTRDTLTQLLNRRGFEEALRLEMQRQGRYHTDFAVLLADIDFFKRINDGHGHAVGDRALCSVAGRLKAELRASDRIGRVGGEEFAILLPDTTPQQAVLLAERLREVIAREPHDTGGVWLEITLSIGVTEMRRADRHAGEAWRRADAALYQAKAAGRNRVVQAA